MGKGTVYSRLLRDILFDIGHFDFVTLKIYLNFLKEFLHSQLSGKSDLSSESFFWAREYHARNIEGRPVYGEIKGEKCKESIAFALNELRKRFRGRLNLIEVGCGPTSQFYCDDLSNCCDLNIITVDPLANHYNQLHQQYNTGYNIRCVNGYGETLAELFKKESFHLAYSQNAVDHSTSPELFVDNLYEILKPGGYLILHGFIKEGSAAKCLGLHKWDIEAQNNDLLLTNRSKSIYKKKSDSSPKNDPCFERNQREHLYIHLQEEVTPRRSGLAR